MASDAQTTWYWSGTTCRALSDCPSDFSDTVREKVIKPYQWGTHLLVMEDGKAYRTPGCGSRDEPGGLQMIWEFEKGPGRMKLQRLGGSQSYWYGKLFIRAPVPN
ncbi:unnamed protein product [Durusdinium trenchii]|uniref:Uncharacterized protein n=2 Tax=Durusdinium trenchii TaxID=1381693 RepID=A0ABP0J153_9DINO